jgi:predicted nucleotidyltransferase
MDKKPFIADKETAHEIIGYMHTTLQRYGVTPCNVAIFGSFLHGNNHPESDLDMIIISEKFEGQDFDQRFEMTKIAKREVMKKYHVPMDILMKSPTEYNDINLKFFESKIVI